MSNRIDFNLVQPAAYDAMDALDQFVNRSAITRVQREFIRLRASQINGCAYCVDAHSADARKLGESEQRIFLVSAWREAGSIFTEEERVVLQMTEQITLIHRDGLSDSLYEKAIQLFGEEKTAQLIMAITTINAWNRIGVATKLQPRLRNRNRDEITHLEN